MKKIFHWLGYIPLLCLANFMLFCIRATYHLGELPQVYQPDPKDLNFDLHQQTIWILGGLSLVIILMILVYDTIRVIKGKSILSQVVISRIGIWLFVLVLISNPLDLVNWFLD